MGAADKRPHGRSFIDAPVWASPSSLRPGEIEALADRYSGRPFEELLRDRDFRRLSEEDVRALTAEFRRRAARAESEVQIDVPGGQTGARRGSRRR
jgi:hypothetical protein